MPGKLKVKVISGRNLPVMDRSTDLTDAFVEVRFGTAVNKTEVFRKSLCPQWNSDWFIFEVEEDELQDEHLQLRVLDHDTYSAHNAIGKVYIDLDPLLTTDDKISVISGWFPIYDTIHGIRGELNVVVKVELFIDVNKFRQSSCGIQFFKAPQIPHGFRVQHLMGFVEELVVNDDPEYQWIDHIRTPRSSNEMRQNLFMKLSGELRRRIGLKILEMGGNAVIGYIQCFDLEGESGIVVRGIGTSVLLGHIGLTAMSPLPLFNVKESRTQTNPATVPYYSSSQASSSSSILLINRPTISPPRSPVAVFKFNFPFSSPAPEDGGGSRNTPPIMIHPADTANHVQSDSEAGSIPRAGSFGESSSCSAAVVKPNMSHIAAQFPKNIDFMEFPFFTLKSFPPGLIRCLGGMVTARSVKLLDRIHNPDEPETRDAWWLELRTEIRSHMKTLGCNAVVGYTEQTTIWEEVIVLSATGTAALINLNTEAEFLSSYFSTAHLNSSSDRMQLEKEKKLTVDVNLANQMAHIGSNIPSPHYNCGYCHIPYKVSSPPFRINTFSCAVCRKKKVSDVLFTTIDVPQDVEIVGEGCFIQARICRIKKDLKGESHAKEISDSLPFIEYELHSQLLTKLKMKGMNCLFSVTILITIGDTLVTAIASATAAFLASLPPPAPPKITGQFSPNTESKCLLDLQNNVLDMFHKNRERFHLNNIPDLPNKSSPRSDEMYESDEDDLLDLVTGSGIKDTFVVEVDDCRDDTVCCILQDYYPPPEFHLSNTHAVPGLQRTLSNVQMFTQVWRGPFISSSPQLSLQLQQLFNGFIKKLLFRLRKLSPCSICGLNFDLVLPDKEEIQLSVTGLCTSISEAPMSSPSGKQSNPVSPTHKSENSDEMIFNLEDVAHTSADVNSASNDTCPVGNFESKVQHRSVSAVEITPLSYIPSSRIDRYLGYYNFFFIRETTSLREEGGLAGFMQSFVYEVLAVARANVQSMSGNALLSYGMNECVLMHNPHKNQAQCLINISGDTVHVTYDWDVPMQSTLLPIPELGSDGPYATDVS